MAKKSLAGCSPAERPAGDRTVETIRSFIVEGRDLGPEDYRAEVVPLTVQLSSTETSDNVNFKSLQTHNYLIGRIRGICRLLAPMDENLSLINSVTGSEGVGSPTVRDRVLLKAMNCNLQLTNTDNNQDIIDQTVLGASVIMERPIDLAEAPHILPANMNLELTATLVGGSANLADNNAVAGANTEYGVLLEGWYVRVRAS